jgi:hypothetical protein
MCGDSPHSFLSFYMTSEHAFSFAILLRGVGAWEAQLDTTGGEKAGGSMIDEFSAIVILKWPRCDVELRVSIGNELNNMVVYIRFVA